MSDSAADPPAVTPAGRSPEHASAPPAMSAAAAVAAMEARSVAAAETSVPRIAPADPFRAPAAPPEEPAPPPPARFLGPESSVWRLLAPGAGRLLAPLR